MALATGDRLGPYAIESLLGTGGMGEVYRGLDTRLGRTVALKVISQRLIGDAASRRRFETEARAASALNHPSIVTIYDVGESGGISWIAMEWVEGQTLRQSVAAGPLAVRHAWAIAKDLAAGLAAAHAKGVIHRDLKPDNVMLTAEGRAKILDFGLARRYTADPGEGASLETVAGEGATFAGTILGTAGYMSPEQAAGRTADFRSDQFSFGIVVYELLTAHRPFARPTAVETLSATIRDEPVPLTSLRPGVSDAFHAAIRRCLAKQPEDRFQTTRELAGALESLSPESGEPTAASFDAPTAISSAGAISPARRRVWIAAGAAVAVVVAALAAGGWYVSRPAERAPITSVAVLPFDNTSGDPDVEYLGDGLTESLIDHLSRVSALKVMARGTVMRFKDVQNPQDAGRSLGVGAVVSGEVTRRGDQVVIATELIDTATGERLWGQTFDRPLAELFRVQDAIVAAISEGLRLRLSGEERASLGGYGTDNIGAYELFLKARHLLSEDTEESDLEALALLTDSVKRDPNFVDARILIASIYARRAGNGYAPPQEALAMAAEEMDKVRAIDPDSFTLRASEVGNRFLRTRDWAAAEQDFRVLAADPRLLRGNQYHPVALFFMAIGRPEDGVALLERALVFDPANTESRVMLGSFLAQGGRLDEAMKVYDAIRAAEPNDPRAYFGAADVHKQRGEIAAAIEARRKAYELQGQDDAARAFAGARTETDYERAVVRVARMELKMLETLAERRYVSSLDFARLYAQVGETERAFSALRNAMRERPVGLTLLKVDRAWDSIRADPRFAEIVREVGIP